jgi:hypothetical protein
MSTPAQKLQSERLTFPGMLPREILVFQSWLKQHEMEYDRFDYNVRLGGGFDPGPTWDEAIRRMAIANTQKRVDAVGYQGNLVSLIEVKDRAGFSAIGQLVGYEALWLHENPGAQQPRLILVCNRFAPDILPVLQKQGIELNVVEADFSRLKR